MLFLIERFVYEKKPSGFSFFDALFHVIHDYHYHDDYIDVFLHLYVNICDDDYYVDDWYHYLLNQILYPHHRHHLSIYLNNHYSHHHHQYWLNEHVYFLLVMMNVHQRIKNHYVFVCYYFHR
jgi:hypothetical protein